MTMNSSEQNVRALLMPFADGELDDAERAAVEQALAAHPEMQAELDELAAISAAARTGFGETVPDVDLSGVFDGVMARLDAETAQETAIDGVRVQRELAEPASPGFMQRVIDWFKGAFTFEQPLASALVAAAVIGLIAMWVGQGPGETVPPSDRGNIANVEKPRRGLETESMMGRNQAYVDHVEVADGKVRIEIDEEDPDAPIVLWHETNGEKGL